MGEWLDLLAENPSLLNQSLNSTGPFRWFIYESLVDWKPLDRMVTELILMRGDPVQEEVLDLVKQQKMMLPLRPRLISLHLLFWA